jgi:hypothetical protein
MQATDLAAWSKVGALRVLPEWFWLLFAESASRPPGVGRPIALSCSSVASQSSAVCSKLMDGYTGCRCARATPTQHLPGFLDASPSSFHLEPDFRC